MATSVDEDPVEKHPEELITEETAYIFLIPYRQQVRHMMAPSRRLLRMRLKSTTLPKYTRTTLRSTSTRVMSKMDMTVYDLIVVNAFFAGRV